MDNKKTKDDKNIIRESVKKMLSDKDSVRSYLKGKSSISTLNDKGIKFGKPL